MTFVSGSAAPLGVDAEPREVVHGRVVAARGSSGELLQHAGGDRVEYLGDVAAVAGTGAGRIHAGDPVLGAGGEDPRATGRAVVDRVGELGAVGAAADDG